MYEIKIYQYDSTQEDNGYRGIDYSKYILQGTEITEDITQELDTAELTLAGLSTNKEFDPETKFIIDIIDTELPNEKNPIKTHHFCVARDIVNQPILSDDNYFDHHISFIEPSVIAQKRLVDNIAVTYKLKDVNLQTIPAFPQTTSSFNLVNSYTIPPKNFGKTYSKNIGLFGTSEDETIVVGKYFQLEGTLKALNRNNDEFTDTYNNIENFADNGGYYARFEIPKLAIYAGINDTKNYQKIGYASLCYTINEFSLNDETNPTNIWEGTFISNSNLGNGISSSMYEGKQTILNNEWLLEQIVTTSIVDTSAQHGEYNTWYLKKYTDTSANTPTYITQEIPLQVDKKYTITIYLYQFPDNIPSNSMEKYLGSQPSYYVENITNGYYNNISGYLTIYQYPINQFMTANKTSCSSFYVTYNIDSGEIVYTSSTPYSALALLQKAIINSYIYEKKDGVYIADVNNSNLPFYIDENYIDKLAETSIIENFYNQKNLWEIMLEVGNYIHSIPELVFGEDDKFKITFNPLGRTDEKINQSNKISIFNSRSVEDYISATSSYVTNMVQLGGLIEEWVYPKTTNDDLLVSNNTAEIIVTKPIIELLEIKVRKISNNAEADLTPFIYEENVYKTLSLEWDENPNRGIAMYYSLGTNIITGGQYQLPQANTNPFTDYTLKKIIWCAYNNYEIAVTHPDNNYWENILISDYCFYVKYRTKDSVRQNHIRPDLRKYLLNSKYDKIPQHNQFNNQTDVVVDSIKFGNNMYGKLIKTGNSEYEKNEWNDKYEYIKHKGELYRINGELYYVAKVKHIYFNSHIISTITFSKDYNELSKIIGIPSEPRFYEISEQSLIWREVVLNDIILLTDDETQLSYGSNYIFNFNHIYGLIVDPIAGSKFAKYALTVFKGDKDIRSYNQTGGQADYYIEIFSPINAYSSENTLTYEWDMIDNYSAGDKVIDVTPNTSIPNVDERAYKSLKAVPYTDIYGKAALLDFYILTENNNEFSNILPSQNLPESPIKTKNNDISDTRPFLANYALNIVGTNVPKYDEDFNGRGIGLLKDCREALSINYNLQLVTNSDTFVFSPYLFLPNKQNIRLVLLANEVNKLSNGYIDNSDIITPLSIIDDPMYPYGAVNAILNYENNEWNISSRVVSSFGIDPNNAFGVINPKHFDGTDGYQQVKAIALICDVSLNAGENTESSSIPNKSQFIIARNIPSSWDKERAFRTWWFGSPNKNEIFKNKQ